MYPNIGQGNPQPSAPPQPPSSSNPSALGNTGGSQPIGFSSMMAQPSNQQPPYPSGPQASLPPYNNPYGSNNQPPKQGNFSSYSLPQVGQQPPPQQG